MTEPVIAAAEQAAVTAAEAAAKELAPEAETLLRNLESAAASHFAALEAAIPGLVERAEGASAHAVSEAQQYLGGLLKHLGRVFGTEPAASGVDPTSGPSAPQS